MGWLLQILQVLIQPGSSNGSLYSFTSILFTKLGHACMGCSGLEDCRGRTDASNMNKAGSEKMSSKRNNGIQFTRQRRRIHFGITKFNSIFQSTSRQPSFLYTRKHIFKVFMFIKSVHLLQETAPSCLETVCNPLAAFARISE